LQKVPSVTVGHLVGFMNVYNLRFGAAATPQQKMIYKELYPMLDAARDNVAKAIDESVAVQNNPEHVGDFFKNMNLDDIDGKPAKPPKPQE
jgi:hypothetical protein